MIAKPRLLVRMPDLVGLPLRKAKMMVENIGLKVDTVLYAESYEPEYQTLSQKPGRGQMIYSGERVTLTISRTSYLKFLPSIFHRQDVNGNHFVRDLLWMIQSMFTSVNEQLDVIHKVFDSYEAPEEFLPWLAGWSAMVLEEDWPLAKKRLLTKKAVELYRVRGTVKGLKLFISLFTGHEPTIHENTWPFRSWRVGVTSEMGVDTVVLPPVKLSHCFVVEMPVAFADLSPDALVRIHEIIRTEKPANTHYYLKFAAEKSSDRLREFMMIGTSSAVPDDSESEAITSEAELQKLLEERGREPVERPFAPTVEMEADRFSMRRRVLPPLPKGPRADAAPVEGREVLSSEAGGFGRSAREMQALPQTTSIPAVSFEENKKPPAEEAKSTKKTGAHPAVIDDAKSTKKTGAHAAVKKSDKENDPEPSGDGSGPKSDKKKK